VNLGFSVCGISHSYFSAGLNTKTGFVVHDTKGSIATKLVFQIFRFKPALKYWARVAPLSCSAGTSIETKRLHSPARVLWVGDSNVRRSTWFCKYGRCYLVMVFVLTFLFIWFSLLILHVFVAVYFKVFFGNSIHSKVLSLSVFKTFLRIFMFRFIRAFKNVSSGMELS
jgi:hypothetical protein